ncbi:hypothetical protein AVEN_86567-1 [Araneus ventricosus]|uniref:Uncharacterized protein n=1 Tax=Araneus ventricosus TaxID=182803 RepID=A0A4Y2Q034_ARAVE|nr:hypothetical protein AVEN_9714-1 [Araneus ventricosus]GBN57525.1 hypothetical protein AVEN_86567-1 [Araneus ventricosus]
MEALVNFISEQWITYEPASFKTVVIYFSHGKVCHSIIPKDENIIVEEIPELMNDHEEAGTKLLLHAYYASKSSPAVFIKSLDTDVFILSLAASDKFHVDLYLIMGTNHSFQIKNIMHIAQILGSGFCSAIVGLHIFTGCDTCSAFKGKGKIKPLKIMQSNLIYSKVFQDLGSSWELTTSLINNLEAFVCNLYGYPSTDQINDVCDLVAELPFILMHPKPADEPPPLPARNAGAITNAENNENQGIDTDLIRLDTDAGLDDGDDDLIFEDFARLRLRGETDA